MACRKCKQLSQLHNELRTRRLTKSQVALITSIGALTRRRSTVEWSTVTGKSGVEDGSRQEAGLMRTMRSLEDAGLARFGTLYPSRVHLTPLGELVLNGASPRGTRIPC